MPKRKKSSNIKTGGGAHVEGDVRVDGQGTFIGRDKKSSSDDGIKPQIIVALITGIFLVLAATVPAIISSPIFTHLFDTATPTFSPTPAPKPVLIPVIIETIDMTQISAYLFTPTYTLTPTLISTATNTNTLIPPPLTIKDSKGVEMNLIPGGGFIIGYDKGTDPEKPQNNKNVDAFYIDKFEVTNKFYEACVKLIICKQPHNTISYTRTDYYGNPHYDDYPVIYVDWYMAKTYCEWRDARLPTEPEWEKAARGTEGRLYPWGNNIDYSFANYSNYVGDTTKVGSYEIGKSIYGVYDMAGNVSEWVSSIFWSYPYITKNSENDSDVVHARVTRGGDWRSDSISNLRSSYRVGYNLYYQGKLVNFNYLGFRCARSVVP